MQKEGHKSVIADDKIVLYGHYKKVLSIIFSVLAGLALIAFLLAGSINNTIVNPQYYKDIFSKANTYNDLMEKGIPSVVMEASISDDAVTNMLAKQGIVYVIKNTIPASWVQSKVEVMIDGITNYISNSKQHPEIVVKLNDLDGYLTQIGDGLDVLNQIIPSCANAATAGQELKGLLNVDIDCSKMSVSLDDIKAQIAKGHTAIENFKVAEVDLTDEVQKGADVMTGINQFANTVNGFYWWSLVVMLLSLITVVLLQFKNIYSAIKYVTIPVASASGMVLLAAMISKPSVLNALDKNFSLETTSEMQTIVTNFLHTAIVDRYTSVMTTSSILFGVSLAVLVISILMHRKKHD